MKESEIQKTIVKFLNKEANITELEKLEFWLINNRNTPIFNRLVKVELLTAMCMNEYDVNKAKDAINKRIKNIDRKRRITMFKRVTVAASILLIIGTAIVMFNNSFRNKEIVFTKIEAIDVGSTKAILTKGDGSQVSLEKGKEYQTEKMKGNGEELIYMQSKDKATTTEDIKNNYLTVPRGGEYSVVLADGTKVRLNSDSKLKYPERFINGKARNVELIYGEAFFDVSPSYQHKGSFFNLYSKGQKISVIGTQFNVKAYNEDNMIATTLVEGKVVIEKGALKKVLMPNQQAKIIHDSNTISIEEIDVSKEISWLEGLFIFEEETLEEIMKTLARWYNTEVIFEIESHKKIVFTGVLKRTKSIEDLLESIEETSQDEIRFEIKNKTILIK